LRGVLAWVHPCTPRQIKWGSPDVLPLRGTMIWARGMGLDACEFLVKYCMTRVGAGVSSDVCVSGKCKLVGANRSAASAWHPIVLDTLVDPFCGYGSVLAIANDVGLNAVGVDLSRRRCRGAARLSAAGFRSSGWPDAANGEVTIRGDPKRRPPRAEAAARPLEDALAA